MSLTSRTYPAVDGLLLRIAVPQNAMTLHVRANALTTDIDLSALARDAGGVAPLGDGRNGLAWIGYPDRRALEGVQRVPFLEKHSVRVEHSREAVQEQIRQVEAEIGTFGELLMRMARYEVAK